MNDQAQKLKSALGLNPREHVAIVGAGGKTTLLFALAHELCLEGRRVITTTTTKIWYRQALESACEVFFLSELTEEERIKEGLDKWGHVFVAQSLSESEKVGGLEPEVADALFNREWCDYQLVEADGAAQRPLKAPEAHEPVYPKTCSKVVAMAGLEVLGKPLEPDLVFRIERFQEVTGVRPGEKISCEVLARLFLSEHGAFRGAPAGAVRVVFLNKADLLSGNGEMNDLADLILSAPESPIDRVILGSIPKGNYRVIK